VAAEWCFEQQFDLTPANGAMRAGEDFGDGDTNPEPPALHVQKLGGRSSGTQATHIKIRTKVLNSSP
jgi:hypothetical protein